MLTRFEQIGAYQRDFLLAQLGPRVCHNGQSEARDLIS
jgi:hypothetical protein